MIRNFAKILSIFVLLQLNIGCSSFTPSLKPDTKPDPGTGYVYGKFTLVMLNNGRLRMGLAMDEEKKEEEKNIGRYTIEFEQSNAPTLIAIKPGNYVLKKFVYAYNSGQIVSEKLISEGPLTKVIKIEPGKAYYIADFVGQASFYSTGGGGVMHSWRLDSIKDNFNNTTIEFKNKYPEFKKLETERALKF
jgi:hypothetical protein